MEWIEVDGEWRGEVAGVVVVLYLADGEFQALSLRGFQMRYTLEARTLEDAKREALARLAAAIAEALLAVRDAHADMIGAPRFNEAKATRPRRRPAQSAQQPGAKSKARRARQ